MSGAGKCDISQGSRQSDVNVVQAQQETPCETSLNSFNDERATASACTRSRENRVSGDRFSLLIKASNPPAPQDISDRFRDPSDSNWFSGGGCSRRSLVATHSSLRLSILIEFTVPADSLPANH